VKRLALIGALALLALMGPARAEPAARRFPYAWAEPAAPFKIIDNLYWVGAEGIGSFLITTPGGDFLIDGGLPSNAPRIENSIRALGFSLRDVKLLLNTHAHFDHSGGLAQLKRDTGAPNPFIDAKAFGAFIDAAEGDFNKQLAAQEAAPKAEKR